MPNEDRKYIVKNFDTEVFSFEFVKGEFTDSFRVLDIFDESLLPEYFRANGLNDDSLESWLSMRKLPSNRTFADEFLAKFGLDSKDIAGILELSKGLSLNDCFWIVPEGFGGKFADYNLYENPFSEIVGQIAFTGEGTRIAHNFISSPEFTTGGMLAKCWRRIDGKVYLYKSGTFGYANAGNEPYSEFYAAQLAEYMGLNHVSYNIEKWKGKICSVCPIFTSTELSYIPMGTIIPVQGHRRGFENTLRYLADLEGSTGETAREAFADMLVFDCLIENTDRHLNNFGMLTDSRTGEVKSMAPLFDHGFSLLFHAALESELPDLVKKEIPQSPTPALYNDFFLAARFVDQRHRGMLRKLLEFEFTPHPVYNVSKYRLRMLSLFVRNRASLLLERSKEVDPIQWEGYQSGEAEPCDSQELGRLR